MFLQIAKQGENAWWRYLATIVVVVFGLALFQMPFKLYLNANGFSDSDINDMVANMNFEAAGIGPNLALFNMLIGFVGGVVGLWFGVVFFHKKKFRWLITPFQRINWGKIGFSFALWMALGILMELVFYAKNPENYSLNFQPDKFPGLVLVSLLVFPFQTSFEELIFRGYMMQGVSLISRFRWIPLLLTSVCFGLMHMMNEEVSAFGVGLTMTYYIGTGLFLGIITLMDDSLELALGIHAATNIYASLFVTFGASSLKTAALFEMKTVDMGEMLVAFFATAIIFMLIVAKKYNWANWAERCLGRVSKPQTDEV